MNYATITKNNLDLVLLKSGFVYDKCRDQYHLKSSLGQVVIGISLPNKTRIRYIYWNNKSNVTFSSDSFENFMFYMPNFLVLNKLPATLMDVFEVDYKKRNPSFALNRRIADYCLEYYCNGKTYTVGYIDLYLYDTVDKQERVLKGLIELYKEHTKR